MPNHLNCNLTAFLVASLARTHLAKNPFVHPNCQRQYHGPLFYNEPFSGICCMVALALLPLGWEAFLPGHLHPWLLVIWLAPSFGLVLFLPRTISFFVWLVKRYSAPPPLLTVGYVALSTPFLLPSFPEYEMGQLYFENMMNMACDFSRRNVQFPCPPTFFWHPSFCKNLDEKLKSNSCLFFQQDESPNPLASLLFTNAKKEAWEKWGFGRALCKKKWKLE